MNYQEFTKRNSGYISSQLQQTIKSQRLLIAGCGIGSNLAECAVRMGFENITLVDKDKIELHNLNRQCFENKDIGEYKVEALAKRLLAINPSAKITKVIDWVHYDNAKALVDQSDVIFDTIDLMSVHGLIALHDECHRQKKPVISVLSVGWGAGAIIFKNQDQWSFRKVFGIPAGALPETISYVEYFKNTLGRIAQHLNPEVVQVLAQVFQIMEDGKPCPASQIAPGAFSVGVIGMMAVTQVLNNKDIATAPNMILIDPITQFKSFRLI